MKKLGYIVFTCLMLVACSEEKNETKELNVIEESKKNEAKGLNAIEESKYVAEINYFKDIVLRNDADQFMSFNEDGAWIHAAYHEGRKTDIDILFENEAPEIKQLGTVNYKDITIEVDESMYYILLDNKITLEFERIGERIFKDSQGVRYYAQNKQ